VLSDQCSIDAIIVHTGVRDIIEDNRGQHTCSDGTETVFYVFLASECASVEIEYRTIPQEDQF